MKSKRYKQKNFQLLYLFLTKKSYKIKKDALRLVKNIEYITSISLLKCFKEHYVGKIINIFMAST